MKRSKSLSQKIYVPVFFIGILFFSAFCMTSFFIIRGGMQDSLFSQSQSTLNIFAASIRDDIINGLNSEVYRKCTNFSEDSNVVSINISSFDGMPLCEINSHTDDSTFLKSKSVYFDSDEKSEAAKITIEFKNSFKRKALLGISVILLACLAIAALFFWFFINGFMKRELKVFTNLADKLASNDFKNLSSIHKHFPENHSYELDELCLGVEKLSDNWGKLQKEVVKNERLNAANEASRLLAHDIKSPLSGIKAASQMLDSKPEQSLSLMERCVVRIEQMLEDITSKSNSEPLPLNFEVVDIRTLVEKMTQDASGSFSNFKNVQIASKINVDASDAEALVNSDHLRRSILNLIKNACEALPESGGEVTLECNNSSNGYILTVSDNGPGIPESLLNQVGQEDFQSQKAGGSGLGLLQVRKTAESHGSTLEIQSSKDGTRISFSVPKFGFVYPKSITLSPLNSLCALDDEQMLGQIWDEKLEKESVSNEFTFFNSLDEFSNWAKSDENSNRKKIALIDYDLGHEENGVSVLMKFNFHSKYIVTGEYGNPILVNECIRNGIGIIPKEKISELEFTKIASSGEHYEK